MKAGDQRQALIETGVRLMHHQGYALTGVREITAAAGVPQGSFTNHFRSKDRYVALVLDAYFERVDRIMRETLEDRSRPPAERLFAYFARIEGQLAAARWQRGCLIVDLAAEAPVHSELLRARLCALLARQTSRFEAVFAEAFADDASISSAEVNDTASFVHAAWHGTLVRIKVVRGDEPLQRFRRVLAKLLDRGVRGPGQPPAPVRRRRQVRRR